MKKHVFYYNPFNNESMDLGKYKKIQNKILKTNLYDITLSKGNWEDCLEEKYDYYGLYGKKITIDKKKVIIDIVDEEDLLKRKKDIDDLFKLSEDFSITNGEKVKGQFIIDQFKVVIREWDKLIEMNKKS